MIEAMRLFEGLQVTINTTEDCNLRCSYCYEINKKKKNINFDTVKKFIDILCTEKDPVNIYSQTKKNSWVSKLYQRGINLDFIGGDPLMNIDIFDNALSYWVYKVNTTDTVNCKNWRKNWRASASTNGTLFKYPEVRRFCEKWSDNLSLGISIDGCPEIHDKNRIYPGGRGTMNDILEYWDWYKNTFKSSPIATKATCNKDSIPYLLKSLKYMHETLGINQIFQNFIMEDMSLTKEDLDELRHQMDLCTAYVFEHRDDLYWSMIDRKTFADHHLSRGEDWELSGHCGSGRMPALSIDGLVYPCFRWLPHTQKQSGLFSVGNVSQGLTNKENFDKVSEGAYRCNCTKDEMCKTCEYESACAYCIGGCYAEFDSFKRTTHICDVTKIQCEAAKKYWKKIEELK